MRNIKFYFLLIQLIFFSSILFSQNEIHRISKELKIYELSLIWKELSYNFANMDNCPGLNMDSLYRKYMSIVTNTENDFEYFKSLQQFLAHFNNGHTHSEMPKYIWENLTYPLLITSYKSGKLFIENIGSHYTKDINIGDEIIKIDNIPAMKYIEKFGMSYIAETHANTKIKEAMFGRGSNYFLPKTYKKKITLEVKGPKGIRKAEIPYDKDVKPSFNDSIKQSRYQYIINKTHYSKNQNNFLVDSVNSFSYIRLTECNKQLQDFYLAKYDSILMYKNLILDLSDNEGGDGRYTATTIFSLTDSDSLRWFDSKTRIHNAHYKAKAASRIYYFSPEEVTESDKKLYYPFFYNNAYETVDNWTFNNPYTSENRYNGNIYVIMNENTASAAEQIILTMQFSNKVVLLGKKTSGALGQPLTVKLPSGIIIYINTSKTINSKGVDVSSGIIPDIEFNFSDFYLTESEKELLKNFIEFIRNTEVSKI